MSEKVPRYDYFTPEAREFINEYRDDAIELIQENIDYFYQQKSQLELAIKSQDYDVIREISHDMKGNSKLFGFPDLSEIGYEMEIASKERNFEGVTKYFERLETQLEDISKYHLDAAKQVLKELSDGV